MPLCLFYVKSRSDVCFAVLTAVLLYRGPAAAVPALLKPGSSSLSNVLCVCYITSSAPFGLCSSGINNKMLLATQRFNILLSLLADVLALHWYTGQVTLLMFWQSQKSVNVHTTGLVSKTGILVLQVEQRSELVDVVTKLAKEEAAAEKGAAAAAKADPASAAAGDKAVPELREQDGKRNAAAALKQVAPVGRSLIHSMHWLLLVCGTGVVKSTVSTNQLFPQTSCFHKPAHAHPRLLFLAAMRMCMCIRSFASASGQS